jgi:pimeloyl-ACP methyl ester carboxylesterase
MNARMDAHYGTGRVTTPVYDEPVPVIPLNGHPTWVRLPKGRGPVVLLLHGGMSASSSLLESIGPGLKKDFALAAFDRRGHGRTADTDAPFSYEAMSDEAVAFIEYLGRRVHVVGHSDGGNVALILAMRRPDLVKRVVAVGANFHFQGLMPIEPMDTMDPAFDEWAQRYARRSPDDLAHAWVVARKSDEMIASQPTLTTMNLSTIHRPVLVMVGDDDVATLAHTCAMYEAIEAAQLAVVPGTSHGVLKERTKESVRIIRHFLRMRLPPESRMPLRRRTNDAD